MQRVTVPERAGWQKKAEDLGFACHTIDGKRYWDEGACYRFTLKQIEQDIEDPTQELHDMTFALVDEIVESEALLRKLHIPENRWDLVRNSWKAKDPHLYGRMDLAYSGGSSAKLFELNYDTPASLYEASFFQWMWLEDGIKEGFLPADADQYNSIQECLINAFAKQSNIVRQPLYLTSLAHHAEDRGTVLYLQDCAIQAGLDTHVLELEDMGWTGERFVDEEGRNIDWCFKLYPWEDMFRDQFAEMLKRTKTLWMEPAWKSLLSNKGILPLLWQAYKGHPHLLESYFEEESTQKGPPPKGWVRKRVFSREGANIDMNTGFDLLSTEGDYGEGPSILQKMHMLMKFTDKQGHGGYPVIGSWIVGDKACGMGIREDDGLITKDTSRFVPHVIADSF